ncbi:MAG TPA: ABC transporter substrate-binding protein [Verrucomicrobiae bacterium]|nr:ABC transporter substrate-binding protein [Verrucomicrobiae bacterium]
MERSAHAETTKETGRRKHFKKVLTLAGFCLFLSSLMGAQLSPQQAIGKHIFSEGASPSNTPIEAILGGGTSRIPGRLMPCASCHGADGQGRPEGGVTPSNITWDVLERALTSSDPLARRRPAYDIKGLRRAIRDGVDPAGHQLGLTMPRFRMSDADLNSLIEYLHILGNESDPGLTNSSIHIGSIIPADGPMAATASGFAGLLQAYFKQMNHDGGIYGRQIEFSIFKAKGTPREIAAAAEKFVREQKVFVLDGVFVAGAEKEIAEAMQKAGVPVIMPFASERASDESSEKSKIFYVLSGLSQEARVLVRFARHDMEKPASSIAVVFPKNDEQLADTAVQECHKQAFGSILQLKYSDLPSEAGGLIDSLHRAKVDAMLFLGDGKDLHQLLLTAKKANWSPVIFQPGAFAGADVFDIPQQFDQQVYFSFPLLPSDIAIDGRHEYETLIRNYAVKVAQPLIATSALAAGKVLAEGLRESGRQLSRQKLVDTLATMYSFDTGLTPPVTFGATRRIGALGGYVVKLDLKKKTLLPVDEWMAP